MKDKTKKFLGFIFTGYIDQHSPVHFFGCGWLTLLFMCLGIFWYAAVLLAFICGILWEMGDLINEKYKLNLKIFDPRGGDWFDLMTDAAGIMFSLGVVFLLRLIF